MTIRTIRTTTTRAAAGVAAAALALALAGCAEDNGVGDTVGTVTTEAEDMWGQATGEVEQFFTGPGATPCREHLQDDPEGQRETVRDLLEERGGDRGEFAPAEVDEAFATVLEFCSQPANTDAEIGQAPLPLPDTGVGPDDEVPAPGN